MVANLEKWLAGKWKLRKEIHDDLAGRQGCFEGMVFFEEINGHRLRYHEEGTLYYGHHHGSATQEYLYVFPHPYEARIYRSQHRFFHDLDLRSGFWQVEHMCARDCYKGRFIVESQNAWSVFWDIKGPRKKLTMTYCYRRQS